MEKKICWLKHLMLIGATLFICIVVSVIWLIPSGSGRTMIVDDDGGMDYFTIQDAVDASEDGDEILVWGGIYEENIIIDTSISLIGNGSDQTCVSKGMKDYGIKVRADGVMITGFLINSSGGTFRNDAGIWLQGASNCNITENTATSNYNGIFLNDSNDNFIHFNNCSGNSYIGIQLRASGSNSLHNNTCSDNNRHGMYLHKQSDRNKIIYNVCTENGKNGVLIDHSSYNKIEQNNLEFNGEYGYYINWGTANSWDGNRIYGNGISGGHGIQFDEEEDSGISGFEGGVVAFSFLAIATWRKKRLR